MGLRVLFLQNLQFDSLKLSEINQEQPFITVLEVAVQITHNSHSEKSFQIILEILAKCTGALSHIFSK